MARIKITNGDGWGRNTIVTDAATGDPINGIYQLRLSMGLEGFTVARVEFRSVEVQATARAIFMVAHPETGEVKEVASIAFADGTSWADSA